MSTARSWFCGPPAGWLLLVAVTAYQALVWATFPALPANDAVGYVALGHTSRVPRPYDPYAPLAVVPATSSLPEVEAWRAEQHPCYGYPWVYLALPDGWEQHPLWPLQQNAPPLSHEVAAPQPRETDVMSTPGLPLWMDLIHLVAPPKARVPLFLALNHWLLVATCLVIWRLGVALGAARLGWIAGLLYGWWLLPASRAQELVSEPVFIAFDTAACWLAVQAFRRRDTSELAHATPLRWMVLSSVTLGIAFAVRTVAAPQALVLAMVAAVAVRRRAWVVRLRWLAAALLPFATIYALLVVHNGLTYDRWTLSTGVGRHLYHRVTTMEKRLSRHDPAALRIMDLIEHPRCEGDRAHPWQSGPLDPWIEPTGWAVYFMLRSEGLTVAQADGLMREAALATIEERPVAYAWRSVRNLYRLLRVTDDVPVDVLGDPERWRSLVATWLTPYTHVAPYIWIDAQWQLVRHELPLPPFPDRLPGGVRRALLKAGTFLPSLGGVRTWLVLVAMGFAFGAALRATGWGIVIAWMVAILTLPAIIQQPIGRYGEPALPLQLLLALVALGWALAALFRSRSREFPR